MAKNSIYRNNEFEITKGETLDGKDLQEYMTGMLKGAEDPVWYVFNILEEEELFPWQEEYLRLFYRHKYDKTAKMIRNMYLALGQRCISGNSLIQTDVGLVKIENIPFTPASMVYNGSNWVKFDEVLYAGQKKKWIVTTEYGFKLECSGDHKVLCGEEWVQVRHLSIGDIISWRSGIRNTSTNYEFSDSIKDSIRGIYYKGTKPCSFPTKLTENLAEFIGYIIADGTVDRENRCDFTKGNDQTLGRYKYLVDSLFTCDTRLNGKETSKAKTITILHSQVCKFVHAIGVGCWNAHTKEIPDIILNGPTNIKRSFLRGYFDGDGSAYLAKSDKYSKPIVTVTTVSENLAYQIQQLLLEFGIISGISISKSVEFKSRKKRENNAYTLRIYGKNLVKFEELIGFITQYKNDGLADCIKYIEQSNGKLLRIPETGLKIKSIVETEEFVDMYDLHVPDGNCYLANGFVVHNSGKTKLASIIASYAFFDIARLPEPQKFFRLSKSQELFMTMMATSAQLAQDGIFANMRNAMENNEWLGQWFDFSFKNDRIDYNEKHIHAQVLGSWINTAVGRTNFLVGLDEIDYFEETKSKRSGWEIYSRMNKSRDTLGQYGKMLVISSPKTTSGPILTLSRQAITDIEIHGIDNVDSLGLIAPTWELNPRPEFSKASLFEKYKHDIITLWRDYGCRPEMAGGMQFPEGIYMDPDIPNILRTGERPLEHYPHVMAIDPAVTSDKFGIGVGYKRPFSNMVVDGVTYFRKEGENPYILPSDVWEFIHEAIPRCNVSGFVFDAWMFPEVIERVKTHHGIVAEKHIVLKEDYDRWRSYQDPRAKNPLQLCWEPELKTEADELVVVESKTGKPGVNHQWNKCFTGDTRISLLNGTFPMIQDLVGKEVWVYSCDSEGNIHPGLGRGRKSGNVKDLIDITLDNGATIRCTPEHLWMMHDGSYKMAKDLKVLSDRLMPISLSYLGSSGYTSCFNKSGKKTIVHRMVAEELLGPIDDMWVHHKDYNRYNNDPSNLEIMTKEDHASLHSSIRHASDPEYSKKATDAMQAFNTSDDGRKFRSDVCKKVQSLRTYADFRRCSEKSRFFRHDITIEKINESYKAGHTTAHSIAHDINCGRNVIIRVLRDNGFESWNEYVNGKNHRILQIEHIHLNKGVDVYDLEVDKWHNFALSCGVFVHNSKDMSDCVANILWYLTNFELTSTVVPFIGLHVI